MSLSVLSLRVELHASLTQFRAKPMSLQGLYQVHRRLIYLPHSGFLLSVESTYLSSVVLTYKYLYGWRMENFTRHGYCE